MARGRELGIQVLAAVRMNDNHFWDLRPADLATAQKPELTELVDTDKDGVADYYKNRCAAFGMTGNSQTWIIS